jgi:hypothetical protein
MSHILLGVVVLPFIRVQSEEHGVIFSHRMTKNRKLSTQKMRWKSTMVTKKLFCTLYGCWIRTKYTQGESLTHELLRESGSGGFA